MTTLDLAKACAISPRSVKRWLATLRIEPTGSSGRWYTYAPETAERIRKAIAAARAARADKIRQTFRRQWSLTPPPKTRVKSIAELKAGTRKRGEP